MKRGGSNSIEARAKMRASWTPERRLAQAERARLLPLEVRLRGVPKMTATMRSPRIREANRRRAVKQWSNPVNRRRHSVIAVQAFTVEAKRRLSRLAVAFNAWYWTPENRLAMSRKMKQYLERKHA